MIIERCMMPAGKYYVGDLCYVINDSKTWSEVCDKTLTKQGKSIEGAFTLESGKRFAMFSTAYGDGEYYDMEGNSYGVDSGTIGCIKVEDINQDEIREDLGNIIEFPNDFYVKKNDGKLMFGKVWIDTK